MSRGVSAVDTGKAMLRPSQLQGERGYELLLAALTEVEDSRPPAFRRLEQAVGGDLARMLVGALAARRGGRETVLVFAP
jgi:hypothetical protein